ncbi:MAG TPA: hypothetical protein VMU72_02480 [Gaiellaceae bacterium]|nr:hypothetical protein [Gaiellaceae bacterium]
MKRALVLATAAAVVAGSAGCGSGHPRVAAPTPQIAIAADPPPLPTTWPAYPHFSQHSCWGRPNGSVTPKSVGSAPSYAAPPRAHPTPPAEIVRRFLARFGDRRYVRSITLGAAPAAIGTAIRDFYGGSHPPADALHAYIDAPLANYKNQAPHPRPAQSLAYGIAEFEAGLVGGALHDDFCSAGGAPLISWSGEAQGIADEAMALEQRFPNPTPAAFRHRVALVGRRYGFRVASLRLLRPEQFAPLLIVRTSRPRKAFVKDAGEIVTLLDPVSTAEHRVALTFEGFFFAVEDGRGPFFFVQNRSRSDAEGSMWAANGCLLPPFGPVGPNAKPCT